MKYSSFANMRPTAYLFYSMLHPSDGFQEMKYNRQFSHCCGGGGGVRAAYPEESAKIADTRLDEADFADVIITTCPFCVTNLGAQAKDRDVKVVDLVELVDEHLQ